MTREKADQLASDVEALVLALREAERDTTTPGGARMRFAFARQAAEDALVETRKGVEQVHLTSTEPREPTDHEDWRETAPHAARGD